MSSSFDDSGSWDRVAAELRARKESQRKAYGDVDNATLGRYLAGDLSADEAAALEQTLDELPELRKLTDLVQDVLSGLGPVESAPSAEPAAPPVILPLAAARPRRRHAALRRYGSLAAACLLFACLTLLPATGYLSRSRPEALALRGGEASRLGAGSAVGLTDQIVWLDGPAPAEVPVVDARPAPQEDALVLASPEQLVGAVKLYHAQGDVAAAEKTLRHNYAACMDRHGADHKATRCAGRQLAGVYQFALNTSEPSGPQHASLDLAKGGQKKCPQDRARDTARQVREQIVRRPAPEVAAEVVPVLNEALKNARNKPERLALIKALGEIGPAAKAESVKLLCERLEKADDEERLAVLDSLDRMGPAASAAEPALARLAKAAAPKAKMVSSEKVKAVSSDKKVEKEADDCCCGKVTPGERAREVLQRLKGREARVGVFDEAGLFSLGRSMDVTNALRKLAREADVEVRVETRRADKPAALPPLGRVSLRVVITSGEKVKVEATGALRDHGIDAGRLEKKLGDCCKGDAALDAVFAAVKQAKK
jgi:hypothetical protein